MPIRANDRVLDLVDEVAHFYCEDDDRGLDAVINTLNAIDTLSNRQTRALLFVLLTVVATSDTGLSDYHRIVDDADLRSACNLTGP